MSWEVNEPCRPMWWWWWWPKCVNVCPAGLFLPDWVDSSFGPEVRWQWTVLTFLSVLPPQTDLMQWGLFLWSAATHSFTRSHCLAGSRTLISDRSINPLRVYIHWVHIYTHSLAFSLSPRQPSPNPIANVNSLHVLVAFTLHYFHYRPLRFIFFLWIE